MKFRHLALTLAAALSIGASAFAASSSSWMYIAYVNEVAVVDCSIYAYDLTFYAPSTSSTATVELYCTDYGAPIAITADAGAFYNGSWRTMSDGLGNYLSYGIFLPDGSDELGDTGYGGTYTWGVPYNTTSVGGWQYVDFPVGLVSDPTLAPANYYYDSVLFTVNY